MTYPEAIARLYELRLFGSKLGLENTRALAALAGHPEKNLRFIHVAGTNGKGSTCAFLEALLRHAGFKTGLFTSPHLVRFNERLQVGREPIANHDLVRGVAWVCGLIDRLGPEKKPTFFEAVTVLALRHFSEQNCDWVIWETGMGGRLDATNIVSPAATVITSIGLDHRAWLGNTLPEIAREKAGIIKPGIPAVTTGANVPEVLEVLREAARACSAPLRVIDPAEFPALRQVTPGLRGEHQLENAALALAACEMIQLPVSRDALAEVTWPGRFDVRSRGGRTLILDGAHNPAGMKAALRTLAREFPGRAPLFIVGLLADKECAEMCGLLAAEGGRFLAVPVDNERTASAGELAEWLRAAHPRADVRVSASLGEALRWAEAEPLAMVTGSLYLVGEAIARLEGISTDERGLNEPLPAR